MSSLVVPSKLGSLCLKYVNVTVMDIERILLSCSVLENLCIVGGYHLTHIKLPHSPLELKHLEVSRCPHLLCIDILAPKLVSFIHHGDPVGELNIRDASFLSELTIGNGLYIGEVVAPACDSFSKYFSQLKYLSWSLIVNQSYTVSKFNLGIDNPRSMKNLTHLRISVKSNHDESLLGWAHLIEASPLLQKLHVKFDEKHAKECAEELGRTLPQDVTFRYTTA
uniref:At1g61320/AtMIF1 LRR domain-containing protein n=1 Tax=Chenopodium quinoa TaxID=63459 RepID=A0A803M7P9_CHEQI